LFANRPIPHSYPTLDAKEEKAVAEVIRSGQITSGEWTARFESQMAEFLGVRYATAVNSGTTALYIALKALEIGRNHEVILPSYTCAAPLQAVRMTGATPIVVDIAKDDINADPGVVIRAITEKTAAIIVIHTYGFPQRNIQGIVKMGVPVIEDLAHSLGGAVDGKALGTFGKIAITSFYATKLLTTGEGGMLFCNELFLHDKISDLVQYRGKSGEKFSMPARMSNMNAAMGLVQISKYPDFIKKRKKIWKYYKEAFSDSSFTLFPQTEFGSETYHVPYRFLLKGSEPAEYYRDKAAEVGVTLGNGVLQPLHRDLRVDPDLYLNTERACWDAFSVPVYPALDTEDLERIVSLVKSFE